MSGLKNNKYFALAAASLIFFCGMGSCGLLGICYPYFMDMFPESLTKVTLISSLGTGVTLIMSFLATKLIDWLTPKWSLLIGTLCLGGHLFFYASATTLTGLYLAGMLSGVGLGLGAQAACAGILAPLWKDKIQYALGICFGISAFGAAAFQGLATAIIAGGRTWQYSLNILAVVALAVGILCNLLFIAPQKRISPEERAVLKSRASTAHLPGLTLNEALKTPTIWILLVATIIFGWCGSPINSISSTYLTKYGVSRTFTSSMITMCTFLGGIYSFIFAPLAKKKGPRVYTIVVCALFALAEFLFAGMVALGMSTVFIVIAYVFGGINRTSMNVHTMIAPDLFGQKELASISAFLYAGFYIGASTSGIIWPTVATKYSFPVMYTGLGIVVIIAFILFQVAIKSSKYRKERLAEEAAAKTAA